MYASRISEPVVGMYQVKLLATCQHASYDGEIIYLIVKVGWISSSKTYATQIVQSLQIVEVRIQMVAKTIVVLCRMPNEAVADVVVPYIPPNYRHLAHVYNLQELLFLSAGLWHAESGLRISLEGQALGDSVRSNGESPIYLRREFPSEH